MMNRRTKIVATLGPATDDPEAMEKLIRAGCDVVRINFSHGDAETHARRIKLVRAIARELDTDVAVLADLSGPKIRIDRFREGIVELQAGQQFTLVAEDPAPVGDEHQVGVAYLGLAEDVSPGSELLLDDGLMAMRVKRVDGTRIICEVMTSGKLSDRKGLNLRGGGLSLPGVSAADEAYLVSKIERTEAIVNLDSVIEASDAVLVARGDLGVEIGEAELPGLQKRIIATSIAHNRPVITATQMMQSMVDSPIPTRAEVLDVANAVIDGTDAVMLSAETAVGRHPARVIEAMARICEGAERHVQAHIPQRRLNIKPERTDQAIAMAASRALADAHHRAVAQAFQPAPDAPVPACPPAFFRVRPDRQIGTWSTCRAARGRSRPGGARQAGDSDPGRRAGLRRRDQYDEDRDHRRARGSPGRSFAADLRESLNGIWLVRSFADWPGSVGEVTRFSDRCSPTADDHFPGNRKPANQPTNPPPDPGRPRPANPLQ